MQVLAAEEILTFLAQTDCPSELCVGVPAIAGSVSTASVRQDRCGIPLLD